MKICLIGMILSHFPNGFFEKLVKGSDGKLLSEEDAIHTLIMEYAKVAKGGDSKIIAVDKKYIEPSVNTAKPLEMFKD